MTEHEILVDVALRFYRKVLKDTLYYVPVGSTAEEEIIHDRSELKFMIKLNTKSELLRDQ